MNYKFLYSTVTLTLIAIAACNTKPQPAKENAAPVDKKDTVVMSMGINSKGIGRFNNVQLTHPLNEEMAGKGKSLFDAKCMACHKLTDEKLVGPGWKGLCDRRSPEWIMNFITNTQVMLDKDLVAQAEVVTCIVRMPNQDLTDDQARDVYEFMRKNDGKN